MCGIAGIIQDSNQNILKDRLSIMLEATIHRGPNNSGIYLNDGIAIGMNRLSILDLSESANQPLYSEDNRYVIVYNGEIYNFKEIRNTLIGKGFHFKTNSDTEVLLNAYVYYGTEVVKIIRGMFAFVIWDKIEKSAFGARDHLGIKPFLYSIKDNSLIFCSELKGMLASNLFSSASLNNLSLNSYLAIGNVIPPHTMIEGISSLKSGHYFTWKNCEFKDYPYWQPELIEPMDESEMSYEEVVKKVRELVLESVEEELISDVPLGVFQSGGLDSAVITAAMRICGIKQIKTYTIGFENGPKGIDESNDALQIAQFYKTEHSSVKITDSYIEENFIEYINGLDQPSADGLNTYLVSKYTSKGVTVALSGLGADELFVGYYGFMQFLDRKPRFPFNLLSPLVRNEFLKNTYSEKMYHVLFDELSKKDDFLKYIFILQRNHERFNSKLLSGVNLKNTHGVTANLISENYLLPKHPLNRIKNLYITQFMSNMLLRDSDAVAMKSSLEVRFPLIDKRIVEFALRIPPSFQTLGSYTLGARTYDKDGLKRILKDAFIKDLPPSLLNRSKKGFQLPTVNWMNGPLKGFLEDSFSNPSEIFDKNEIMKTYKYWKRNQSEWKKVWSVFILDMWYKEVYKKQN